jgi:DNA-binding beta-propeller fold protein YncE
VSSRLGRRTALTVLFLATLAFAPANVPGDYRIVAHLPDVMDGQALRSPRYDWKSHRLFAGNRVGVYSADLSVPKPTMIGPLTHAFVQSVEVAPDLGRVFYSGPTEIGYVDEQGGKGVTLAPHYAGSLAYEPTAHELYASFELLPEIAIFNARTGRLATRLKLPGWSAFQLVAVPGKVFMLLKDKDGMYTIDATTHTIAPWPVKGITTPGRLEADPNGKYLFFTRENEVDAIDIARQTVIGKISVSGEPSVSFDTDSGLLVVGWLHSSPQKFDVLQVVRPTGDGLIPVTSLSNEAGGTELVRSHYGFIQHGFHEFLLWSDVGTAPTR